MLNDSKIAQLNSERPLHQTAVYVQIHVAVSNLSSDIMLRLNNVCLKALQFNGYVKLGSAFSNL